MTGPRETLGEEPPASRGGREHVAGEQIAARYEVRELLGKGSGSAVYRVLDHVVHEEVAVKLIADPEGGVERLRREVQLARRITHPNVCRVFDLVDHAGGALISMELVDGGTLAERARPVGDGELRRIAGAILAGLEAAHAAGVVHRDLKPANVLVGRDGRIVLTDFGVARSIGPVAATGDAAAGTPAYMAPEQLLGEAATPATDLYALGLVLHELAAARLPFVAAGEEVTMPAVLRRLTAPAPRLAGTALADGIARLLAREPGDRPQSAAAARAALGLTRPRRRRAWAAAATAVAAIAAGALALSRRAPVARPVAEVRTLTAGDEGILEPPALAPDGSLVFATNRRGAFELWALDPATAATRPLTSGAPDRRAPQIAGDRVYYLRGPDLVRQGWPPDGREEVVRAGAALAAVSAGGRVVVGEPEATGDLPARLTLDGRTLFDAGEGRVAWAAWSPEGEALAVVTTDAREGVDGALLWVDAATGAARALATAVRRDAGIAWTPGGAVLFLRGPGSARRLYEVERSGKERLLLERLPNAARPLAAPGGRLYFVSDLTAFSLWLYDGKEPLARMTFLGEENALSPTWIEARGQLAWLAGGRELRVIDGSSFVEAAPRRALAADVPYVVASADGAALAWPERRAGAVEIRVGPLDGGGAARTLARIPAPHAGFPSDFSPDGEWLSYVVMHDNGLPSLAEVEVATGATRGIELGAGGGFRSRDGRALVYGKEGALWVRPLPHGAARRVAVEPAPLSFRFFGAGHERLVAVDGRELFTVNIASGERVHLAYLPTGALYPDRLAAHSDGRVVVSVGVAHHALQVVELPR